MSFEIPENEIARLEALFRYNILDTEEEEFYNTIATLAASIMGTPIAAVTFIDAERQWIKAKVGIDATETARGTSFCTHTILDPDGTLVVPDATKDKRFSQNPFVIEDPKIRFYFGAPLVTEEKEAIGAVCAVDKIVRKRPTAKQIDAMKSLTKLCMAHLEIRDFVYKVYNGVKDLRTYKVEDDTSAEIISLYKNLNDQCDMVLSKIRDRKKKTGAERR